MTRIRNVTCIAESEKAILVKGGDLDRRGCRSRSSTMTRRSQVKQTGDLVVQDWWAQKQGWA